MIYEPNENQLTILTAVEKLLAPYRSVGIEQVVERHVHAPALQKALDVDGFLAIGAEDHDSVMAAALIVAEVAKLPFAVEAAASALVRPVICPDAAAPLAMIWGNPAGHARFLPQARTVLLADADGIRILSVADGDVEAVESIFAYPMGRLTPAAIARAEPIDAPVKELLRLWRIAIALEIYGALDSAHRLTIDHVRERHQFGRPLGSFQAIQHRLAMNATSIQACRWLALKAASTSLDIDAVLAAGYAQDAVKTIVYDLHQFSGAMGLTLEYSLHLFTYRAALLQSETGPCSRQFREAADQLWPVDGAREAHAA